MGSQQSRTWLKWLSSSSSILLLIISQVMLGMWLASRRFTFSRLLWSFVVHITIFLLVGYEWQRGMLLISRSCPPVPFFLFPTSSDDGPFSITETRLTPQEMAEQQDRRNRGSWMTSWIRVALHPGIIYQISPLRERNKLLFHLSYLCFAVSLKHHYLNQYHGQQIF